MRTVPLTPAQSGIWFTERLGGASGAYTMAVRIELGGEVDEPALAAAVAAVGAAHPVLEAALVEDDGRPYLVPGAHPLTLLRGPSPVDEPFDAGGPLTRVTLWTDGPGRHVLRVVAHHLVFDGQSKDIVVRALADAYRGTLGTATDAYAKAVAAEQDDVARLLDDARAHWSTRWSGPDDVWLPGVRLDAGSPGGGPGATLDVELDPGLAHAAAAMGLTTFELLLAAVHTLLHRYGNDQATVAIDVGTRPRDHASVVGCFVNELPTTSVYSGRSTLREAGERLRAQLRESYRFRSVPLARAVSVAPGAALAPVSISYRRRATAPELPGLPGLRVRVEWTVFGGTTRGPLHLLVVDSDHGPRAQLRYDARLVPAATAAAVAEHLGVLVRRAVADPTARVGDLPLLGPAESARLTTLAGGPPAAAAAVLDLAAAAPDPDATAVIGADRRLTHRDLLVAADGLAGRLQRAGVGPGALVGVHADRSVDAVVALLAVLRAGAAYLPLDPAYPPDRLPSIVEDARPAVLLAPSDGAPVPDGVPILPIAGPAAPFVRPAIEPDDRAYVIYTSGSTGRPKGVAIPHRALVNLLHALRTELDATPADVWLAVTSLSFDIAALELFLPLVVGASVVVAPEAATRDGRALARLIAEHGVTHVQATPSTWELLLADDFAAPTVTALCGGEALPPALAERLRPRVRRLLNLYGPTETTIWSTVADVTVGEVTIGRPLAGTTAHVLDASLRRVPIGVAGELYLAGAGLAHHYHRRAALTAEAFVPDPYGPPGGRLYRTGDRVRLNSDGTLGFLGRLDGQVKLRGHRIELGEIEVHIGRHPAVRRAVVRVVDPGRLVAYVTAHAGHAAPDPAELRAFLARSLPAVMVPSTYVPMDTLPLTPNGKVNRSALPLPEATTTVHSGLDDVAGTVAAIWHEVLGQADLNLTDDLFDLGGHSLTLTQIAARIRDRLGVDVPLHVLWDAPTIAGMSDAVRAGRKAETP